MFANRSDKYKVYVRRPLKEIVCILGVIALVLAIIVTIVSTTILAAGARIINYNLTPEFIAFDQRGQPVHTVHPKRFSTRVVYVQPRVSYLWGLISFEVGSKELKYHMVIVLDDGTEFQAEVNKEEHSKIGVFDGLEVEYVVGRSGRYYIKAIRAGDAKKNGLGARLWQGLTGR